MQKFFCAKFINRTVEIFAIFIKEWTAVKMNDSELHLTSTNATHTKRLIGDDIIYIKFSIIEKLYYILFRENNKVDSTFRLEVNSGMPDGYTEDLTEKKMFLFS